MDGVESVGCSSVLSDGRSDDQLLDIEVAGRKGRAERPGSMIRLWKMPLPLRKNQAVSDSVKNIAVVMTLLCIVQFVYIKRLKGGLIRVPNDPYDIRFGEDITRDSTSIWDSERQSFLHNALPLPVHSHNDYERRIPLFEALGSGCISVEADVYLREGDLLVGHKASSVRDTATLRSMYLEPLQRMLERQNDNVTDGSWRGLFNLAPQQTFVLLVDHKTSGREPLMRLHAQLQPLRELDYLTYWNGSERVLRPLTIVASGDAPFEAVTALDPLHRDIFWDAKLHILASVEDDFSTDPVTYAYNRSNSYFASTEFKNAILYRDSSQNQSESMPETFQQSDMAATQIEQARARGLLSRYWGTPTEPPNLRDIVWRVLIEEQVDILNMDDLGAVRARAGGWGSLKQ